MKHWYKLQTTLAHRTFRQMSTLIDLILLKGIFEQSSGLLSWDILHRKTIGYESWPNKNERIPHDFCHFLLDLIIFIHVQQIAQMF